MTEGDPPEEALLKEAKYGSLPAFEALVRLNQDVVYSVVCKMSGDKVHASDITQESFIKAYRALKNFRQESSFKTWVTQIAINLTRTYVKQRQSKLSREASYVAEEMRSPETPEEDLVKRREHVRIHNALSQLKAEYREVIILCTMEGYTYSEAAIAIGIPYGTVCSRMNVALSQIKTLLTQKREHE